MNIVLCPILIKGTKWNVYVLKCNLNCMSLASIGKFSCLTKTGDIRAL